MTEHRNYRYRCFDPWVINEERRREPFLPLGVMLSRNRFRALRQAGPRLPFRQLQETLWRAREA